MKRLEQFWRNLSKCGVRVRITSAAKSRIASSAEFHPYHIHSRTEHRALNEHAQNLIHKVNLYKSAISYLATLLIEFYETRSRARLTVHMCCLVLFLFFDRRYEED